MHGGNCGDNAILEYTRKAVEAGRMDADVARDILERNGMDVGGKFSLREGEEESEKARIRRYLDYNKAVEEAVDNYEQGRQAYDDFYDAVKIGGTYNINPKLLKVHTVNEFEESKDGEG